MKTLLRLALLGGFTLPTMLQAQVDVDRKKYPDYDAAVRPDYSMLRHVRKFPAKNAEQKKRPAVVNNAQTIHFPPIFNQDGGSCGSASRIGYMFTHELNSYRNVPGNDPRNQYPTHFVWLHTSGNSGKDAFVQYIGVPSVVSYGGRTYSSLFGNQDETHSDFGWMNGYEKWFEAMHNRMHKPMHFPMTVEKEAGRELVKNFLWNHNGDPDFHSGGIVGLGAAMGITAGKIPNTDANREAGVVGKNCIVEWGAQVDHALTLVGYDDRIEFDIDKNGKYGEKEKDEVGAWIIANSWGGWMNEGLIYCPYARATPVVTKGGKVQNWWNPEIYNVRKNYRPLRTIKVKMDYSHRSEFKLTVGVAADIKATKPERTLELEYFRFAGDGKNGDATPTPAVPMLGRWADGKFHSEPMEFGYDLTDLTEGFDTSKPLKYFFNVHAVTKRNTGAKGKGHIYAASILDYKYDRAGVETPFFMNDSIVKVPGGRITTISTVVYGEQYMAPQNLAAEGKILKWQKPQNCGHEVQHYNVYKDGVKWKEVKTTECAFADHGTYGVAAVYADAMESQTISCLTAVDPQAKDNGVDIKRNGFTIPKIFTNRLENATIEYWIKPHTLSDWNNMAGPGWGTFLCHANANGTFSAGWDTGHRVQAGGALSRENWTHIAMVVKGRAFELFVNGILKGTAYSPNSSGLGGFGDLVFQGAGRDENNAVYDEIRIWDKARTSMEIKNSKDSEFSGSVLPEGLLAYYKGDLITIDGAPYLRDCVGGYHAPIGNTMKTNYAEVAGKPLSNKGLTFPTNFNTKIQAPKEVMVGQPALFSGSYADGATSLMWSAPDANVKTFKGTTVSLTFDKTGQHTVTFTASNQDGTKTGKATKVITVVAAPEPNAEFAVSAQKVIAGQRVSFVPTKPQAGYMYEWSMPGSDVATSNAINTSTQYNMDGTYNVTLTVTTPQGQKATSSQKITVVKTAPEANFRVVQPVVLKGAKTGFGDLSKFGPTDWEWVIKNENISFIVNGKEPQFSIDAPGVYDVTLTAKNEMGLSKKSYKRGLIVVNADSKQGLNFGVASQVTTQKAPFTNDTKEVTIEWWMNPAKLSDYCCGIGDKESSFFIKADSHGRLLVSRMGRKLQTKENVVLAGQWHHYALVFDKSGMVRTYRDGVLMHTGSVSMTTPNLETFAIGSPSAPMTGQIDEFRVWGSALKADRIKEVSNEPITDVATAQSGADKLLLYYDFNQTGGDVQDRTSNANHGIRKGFGPDGDAWGLSAGVFSLNYHATKAKDVSHLLSNIRKPFQHSSKQINDKKRGRWYELLDWKMENAVVSENKKVITGAHFDGEKNGCFTFTTGWDNFTELIDHKVYQTITLPAGTYTLTTTMDSQFGGNARGSYVGGSNAPDCGCAIGGNTLGTYLVANLGKELPNTAELHKALGAQIMEHEGRSAVNSVTFSLSKESEVSLGLVINMSGQSIASIERFQLFQIPVGTVSGVHAVSNDASHAKVGTSYDLTGRRLQSPQKGQIYIQNGKRVFAQ